MIDKYKIEKTARQISEKVVDANEFDNSKPTHLAFLEGHIDGFNAGAKWMQEEFLKDLWHPASEKPKKGATIIYENHSKNGNTYFYIDSIECLLDSFNSWSNFTKFMRVPRWLYIDDLLPKEGGEK